MMLSIPRYRLAVVLAGVIVAGVASNASAWTARVDKISDGDTVTVTRLSDGTTHRVRIAYIDAPEVAHGRTRPGQPYGVTATEALTAILGDASIDVRPTGATSYDRIVGLLYVGDQDAAARMVRSGYAWRSPKYDTAHRYSDAQAKARAEQRGLWRQSDPTPPWAWRRQAWP